MAKGNIYLSDTEQKAVKAAIARAEKATSGEIRIHIEQHCPEDVLDRAAFMFDKLEMQKTEARNGVLFYMALADHKVAILGDAGINAKVEKDFWQACLNHLITKSKGGEVVVGLCESILMAGEALKTHFPYQSDDVNELSDEISFGS